MIPLWHADFLDDGAGGTTRGVRWDVLVFEGGRVEIHRGTAVLSLSRSGATSLAHLLAAALLEREPSAVGEVV